MRPTNRGSLRACAVCMYVILLNLPFCSLRVLPICLLTLSLSRPTVSLCIRILCARGHNVCICRPHLNSNPEKKPAHVVHTCALFSSADDGDGVVWPKCGLFAAEVSLSNSNGIVKSTNPHAAHIYFDAYKSQLQSPCYRIDKV